jgi:histidinol-phosphate/aromatic aminotransferase/cobyric acid decarboxylase-like protein
VLVRRAGGRPVPVALAPDGAVDLDALLAAATEDTRAAVVCTPNDPTGLALAPAAVATLRERLPDQAWLLLDQALAEFSAQGALALPGGGRVLSLRSFSKAHAMAGFRVGYAVGSDDAEDLLATLAPLQGVNAPAQAGALWAVEQGDPPVERRRAAAARARERLGAALRGTPFAFAPSETNFVWLSSSRHGGPAIAAHLARRGVYVAPGSAWGDDRHVRVTLRDAAATERLAAALREPF